MKRVETLGLVKAPQVFSQLQSNMERLTARLRLRKNSVVEDEGQIQRVCEDAEARGQPSDLDGRRLFPFIGKVND